MFVKGPSRGELQATLVATEGRGEREREMRVPCNLEELRDFAARMAAGKRRHVLPTVNDVGELRCSPKSAFARSSVRPLTLRSHSKVGGLAIEVPLVEKYKAGDSAEKDRTSTGRTTMVIVD